MATTRIMPLHVGKGRTESRAISDIIDYVANPQKTDNGRLIAGFACDSRTVDAEFLLAKRQYIVATGRVRGADDVIAYHVRQSFRPGEITPEEANRLGVEFAKRFTKGNHAFVVCTHIDKSHIHNHIIWSSVSLEYDRKFRNFWGSTKAVRRLSDTICIENGLSIVENPNPHGKSYVVVRSTKPRNYYKYVNGESIKYTVTPTLGMTQKNQPKIKYTLDFDVTPHQLRHTYITNLLYAGVDPKTVQYLAGHENSKTTMDIYAKVKYNKPEELFGVVNGAFYQPVAE